ncbi:MAG: lytic transglycosylase domain-containing protein [Leptospirillum sp.]
MNPYVMGAQMLLDRQKRKRTLMLVAIGLAVPLFFIGLIGLLVLGVAAWLFSPFAGGPPAPPSTLTILSTYLPYEQAAINTYCPRIQETVNYTNSLGITAQKKEMVCTGVPLTFVQAIMKQESDGNAEAISNKGALGLMQATIGKFDLKAQTPASGGKPVVLSPLDPKNNIFVGVQFLEYLWGMFPGNLQLIAAAYNAGPGAPQAWEKQYGTSNWSVIETHPAVQSFAKGQTYNYVNAVMAYYAAFNQGQVAPGQRFGRPIQVRGGGG